MNPRVQSVRTVADYRLEITFDNGEVREFDVSPYLDKGIFKDLKEKSYFSRVKIAMGTVQWPHGQDFCPDTLYEESSILTPNR